VNDLEKLIALEEIKALKARYFRFVDTKDWAGFKALFSPEPVFDISNDVPGCVLSDHDEIVKTVSGGLAGCVSVHHGHCPEIELTSDTTAKGIWAMEDMLRWEDGSNSPIESMHGYGHYVETYERVQGRWCIKTLKLTRMRVDVCPRGK
jgi:hypothetical protein